MYKRQTYFAGASYYTQGANLGKQDYNRWNFRAGVAIKLTSDLKFSATIAGTQQETTSIFTKGLSNLNGYGAVSYTHLDVYKRQNIYLLYFVA